MADEGIFFEGHAMSNIRLQIDIQTAVGSSIVRISFVVWRLANQSFGIANHFLGHSVRPSYTPDHGLEQRALTTFSLVSWSYWLGSQEEYGIRLLSGLCSITNIFYVAIGNFIRSV